MVFYSIHEANLEFGYSKLLKLFIIHLSSFEENSEEARPGKIVIIKSQHAELQIKRYDSKSFIYIYRERKLRWSLQHL